MILESNVLPPICNKDKEKLLVRLIFIIKEMCGILGQWNEDGEAVLALEGLLGLVVADRDLEGLLARAAAGVLAANLQVVVAGRRAVLA